MLTGARGGENRRAAPALAGVGGLSRPHLWLTVRIPTRPPALSPVSWDGRENQEPPGGALHLAGRPHDQLTLTGGDETRRPPVRESTPGSAGDKGGEGTASPHLSGMPLCREPAADVMAAAVLMTAGRWHKMAAEQELREEMRREK